MFEQLIVFIILLIFGIYNALNASCVDTRGSNLIQPQLKTENMAPTYKKTTQRVNFSPQVEERVFSKKTGNILGNDHSIKINDVN